MKSKILRYKRFYEFVILTFTLLSILRHLSHVQDSSARGEPGTPLLGASSAREFLLGFVYANPKTATYYF